MLPMTSSLCSESLFDSYLRGRCNKLRRFDVSLIIELSTSKWIVVFYRTAIV